jgi:hypothetical protein
MAGMVGKGMCNLPQCSLGGILMRFVGRAQDESSMLW